MATTAESASTATDGDSGAPVEPTAVPQVSRDAAIASLEEQAFLTFGDASCVIDALYDATGTYNINDPVATADVNTNELIEACLVGDTSRPSVSIRVTESQPEVPIENQLRVLFVGNSYTYYHDLPATVDLITSAHGTDIQRTMKATGGYFLSDHVRDGEVQAELATGEYDIVVLQEQSVAPSLRPEMYEMTMPFAKTLDAAADEAGVRVIWYQTWGRENGMSDVGFSDYESMQQAVIQGYAELAQATGGDIAAAGESWRRIRAGDTGLDLYTDDGSHPSRIGSYVAAVQIAEAILGHEVTTAPPTKGVDAETAALILAEG